MSLFDSLRDDAAFFVAAADDVMGNLNPLDDRFLSGDAPITATVAEIQLAAEEGRPVDAERIRLSSGKLTAEEEAYAREHNIDTGLAVIGTAAKETAETAIEEKLKPTLSALELLTNPWVLGGVALVVVAAVAAPYVAPFLKGR